jgi:hypothetical protein
MKKKFNAIKGPFPRTMLIQHVQYEHHLFDCVSMNLKNQRLVIDSLFNKQCLTRAGNYIPWNTKVTVLKYIK